MKINLLSTICLLILMIVAPLAQPKIPDVKLFDVRNGNGVIDQGTTYQFATVIVYKNKAAKDQIIQDICDNYGYQDTVPDPANPGQTIANPVGKQQFFNQNATRYFSEHHKAAAINKASKDASATAAAAAAVDVP